jgi:hypothetical protein
MLLLGGKRQLVSPTTMSVFGTMTAAVKKLAQQQLQPDIQQQQP